jgi:hypothetical protein
VTGATIVGPAIPQTDHGVELAGYCYQRNGRKKIDYYVEAMRAFDDYRKSVSEVQIRKHH